MLSIYLVGEYEDAIISRINSSLKVVLNFQDFAPSYWLSKGLDIYVATKLWKINGYEYLYYIKLFDAVFLRRLIVEAMREININLYLAFIVSLRLHFSFVNLNNIRRRDCGYVHYFFSSQK